MVALVVAKRRHLKAAEAVSLWKSVMTLWMPWVRHGRSLLYDNWSGWSWSLFSSYWKLQNDGQISIVH